MHRVRWEGTREIFARFAALGRIKGCVVSLLPAFSSPWPTFAPSGTGIPLGKEISEAKVPRLRLRAGACAAFPPKAPAAASTVLFVVCAEVWRVSAVAAVLLRTIYDRVSCKIRNRVHACSNAPRTCRLVVDFLEWVCHDRWSARCVQVSNASLRT